MKYVVKYSPLALKDLYKLDNSCRQLVLKAIKKVSQNPLPDYEGGYGKPLGRKGNTDLTGYLKIKLRNKGIRVVYKLIRVDSIMYIIVIGARQDDEEYEIAARRNRIK